MTVAEALEIERGALVYFGNDQNDRGIVKDNNGEVLIVRWGRDAEDSMHVIAPKGLANVHRLAAAERGGR